MKLRNKIVLRRVDKLIPYARNAKKHSEKQIDLLAANINEFGFNVPIVVDINDNIVAGHGRVLAAKKLSMTELPCVVVDDLSEVQIKAFRISDNRVPEMGETDWEMLELELEELQTLDVNLACTGYKLDDVSKHTKKSEPKGEEVKSLGKIVITCPKCQHQFNKADK